MLYGHGDNGYKYAQKIVADFSSNVWYGGSPTGLKQHIFNKWGLIHKYPEVLAESLTEKVARHHGLPAERILITAGTTESIYLIAQRYRGRASRILIPAFSEYEDACRIHDHQIDFAPWESLNADAAAPAATNLSHHTPGASRVSGSPASRTDLLWLCNPNNPTGAAYPIAELAVSLAAYPRTMLVLDEAFIEFMDPAVSALPELQDLSNLILLRSLTKAFAIPGLRLGYIVAAAEVIGKLKAIKMPWSVNAFALEAGQYLFDHYHENQLPIIALLKDKTDFMRELREIQTPGPSPEFRNLPESVPGSANRKKRSPALRITDSQTSFFLCQTSRGTAADLQNWLLEQHGLLIRDASNFRGLGPGHFRLATLAPEQNQLLITALKQYFLCCP